MKKVLFATTALVAFAGAAAADVSLSGSAEMGLIGGNNDAETQFLQSVDVRFRLSGETDNGLSFGATVDLDDANDSGPLVDSTDADFTVFVRGDFGTLTMGDTDGALDWAMTEAFVGNAGSIADDETSHAGILSAYGDGFYDGQILRYDYSVADFGVAVSVEMDDAGVRDVGYAIGFRYGVEVGGGDVNFGLGFQSVNFTADSAGELEIFDVTFDGLTPGASADLEIVGVSAAIALDNGLSAGLQYSTAELTGPGGSFDIDHVGVGAGYTIDAFTVSANWGQYDIENIEFSGYGVAAAYDLGGGLSAHVGFGNSDFDDLGDDVETWSLGLAMSF